MSFAARARSARAANDTTREQINNIPEKSHLIIIIINIQGQITSRYKLTHLMSFACSINLIHFALKILCYASLRPMYCLGVVKKSCYASENEWIIIIYELTFSN